MAGRTTDFVDKQKAALKGKQIAASVESLPPGFILGFRLKTVDGKMVIGKGLMHCRGKAVYHKIERVISGEDYVQPKYVLRGMTYYVYMNSDKDVLVDTVSSVWDDDNFGYFHPSQYQFRFLGHFFYGLNGRYSKIVNQDPVVGTDIDADTVEGLLVKTLLAQVTDYIVVGQNPEEEPAADAIACFIYRDKIQIKKYNGATWLVQQQFGNQVRIGAEMYIGFRSFSGMTTLDAPGPGDTVHYISGPTDQYREFTNGGWVVTANGIKIGGILTVGAVSLFLNMIGCGGSYHPSNAPITVEQIPHKDFRVFNFNANYQDQYGIDDWSAKYSVTIDTTKKKFGTGSLTGADGVQGYITTPTAGTVGQNVSIGAWVYPDLNGIPAGDNDFSLFYITGAGGNEITITLDNKIWSASHKINVRVKKGGTYTYFTTNAECNFGKWNHIGIAYDSILDRLAVVVNGTIEYITSLPGTWSSATNWSLGVGVYNNYSYYGLSFSSYIDELLFAWNSSASPDLLAQHYTHSVPWDTTRSSLDYLLRAGVGGRIFCDSPVHATEGVWVPRAVFQHTEANNTVGGSVTTGSRQDLKLNTKVIDDIGITLSSNILTIPPGAYRFIGRHCFYLTQQVRVYLFNNTSSQVIGYSLNRYAHTSAGNVEPEFRIDATFSTTTQVKMQYRCNSTAGGTSALGNAHNYSEIEIYGELIIEKVA